MSRLVPTTDLCDAHADALADGTLQVKNGSEKAGGSVGDIMEVARNLTDVANQLKTSIDKFTL